MLSAPEIVPCSSRQVHQSGANHRNGWRGALFAPRRLFALLSVMKPRGDPFGDSGRPRDCLFTTDTDVSVALRSLTSHQVHEASVRPRQGGQRTGLTKAGLTEVGPVRSKRRVTGTPAATPPPSPRDRRALRKRSTARTQPGHDQRWNAGTVLERWAGGPAGSIHHGFAGARDQGFGRPGDHRPVYIAIGVTANGKREPWGRDPRDRAALSREYGTGDGHEGAVPWLDVLTQTKYRGARERVDGLRRPQGATRPRAGAWPLLTMQHEELRKKGTPPGWNCPFDYLES